MVAKNVTGGISSHLTKFSEVLLRYGSAGDGPVLVTIAALVVCLKGTSLP